jgi:hypothetical protein
MEKVLAFFNTFITIFYLTKFELEKALFGVNQV